MNADPVIEPAAQPLSPTPTLRTALAGILMGLANLVPGVSGGTMIVVMGLYDEFVSAIADATRLRLTKGNVRFLTVLGSAAIVTIGVFSDPLAGAVAHHRSMMFSLFIGMTLGGVPLLLKMIRRIGGAAMTGTALGLAMMLLLAACRVERPDTEAVRQAIAAGTIVLQSRPVLDFFAGGLAMSAMVLPGISGAYMLLILGRYETVLAAVALCKSWVLSGGTDASVGVFFPVLAPVAAGSLLGVLLLSHFLKWMLNRHADLTIGVLLGILLGSVIGIWPFTAHSDMGDYATGVALATVGFTATTLLARIKR
ncbi:MAG: DUF368 domain-containing protein [Phycisphaerae bacterium]